MKPKLSPEEARKQAEEAIRKAKAKKQVPQDLCQPCSMYKERRRICICRAQASKKVMARMVSA